MFFVLQIALGVAFGVALAYYLIKDPRGTIAVGLVVGAVLLVISIVMAVISAYVSFAYYVTKYLFHEHWVAGLISLGIFVGAPILGVINNSKDEDETKSLNKAEGDQIPMGTPASDKLMFWAVFVSGILCFVLVGYRYLN